MLYKPGCIIVYTVYCIYRVKIYIIPPPPAIIKLHPKTLSLYPIIFFSFPKLLHDFAPMFKVVITHI